MKPVFFPATLVEGQKYRARVVLSGLQRMVATHRMIAEKFMSVGFTLVQVSDGPDTSTKYVEGVWGGPTEENVPKPSGVAEVWEL